MPRTLFTGINILGCSGADPFAGEVLVDGQLA